MTDILQTMGGQQRGAQAKHAGAPQDFDWVRATNYPRTVARPGLCGSEVTMKTLAKNSIVSLLIVVAAYGQHTNQNCKSKQSRIAILQEPTVLGVGETWAVVSWTTNSGGKGRSRIFAGTDPRHLKLIDQTPADDAYGENIVSYQERQYPHLVRLNNLDPGTTYYFRADSSGKSDHDAGSASNLETFVTMAASAKWNAKRKTHAPATNASASVKDPAAEPASAAVRPQVGGRASNTKQHQAGASLLNGTDSSNAQKETIPATPSTGHSRNELR